ncbi:MAG: enoyl-CoA hydratase/isomerase family protein [Deltaproteobacteria bacterium]|nr:enoyl-CoA hydratase/isomerase family protein [Deltaproteobacteria bacterium]
MAEDTYETIQLEMDPDGVALCTLNRPEVHNALNFEMVRELDAAVAGLGERSELRALIFIGAGDKAFASGADIAELARRGKLDALRRINAGLFRRIEQLSVPTIAAIRGYALGGGCELALACDLRICGQGAQLGQPEVSLGIIPGAGATYRLPRLIGLGRAREIIFTGRRVSAAEALTIGLVNQVVPDEEVLAAARQLARTIAAHSPLAVRLAKAALNLAAEGTTDAGMALEATAQAVLFEDDEKVQRMSAFLEWRSKKGD